MEHDEHAQIERSSNRAQWPARKIVGCFLIVFLVFAAGVAVGQGNLHIGKMQANGERAELPNQLDYSSINKIYNLLRENFDGKLTQDQLTDGLKTGLVSATGDPYTNYFNPKEAKEFDEQLSGSFTGIGAELGTDKDGHVVIVSPLSGYPAEKAGLKPKDIIAAVNKDSITQDTSVDAVVKKIRGEENTKVTLTIVRGRQSPFNVTITRAKITIASVKSSIDGKIGYLKISQFGEDTVDLAKKAARDFKAKGVKAVVLDLRGDPGGYLNAAVDVSSLWLDEGKTVVSERKGGEVQNVDYAKGGNILSGLPTVVLIDGGSASASEIVSGALHDNKAASLVGEKSFGKGSVQKVITLDDGGELKVTIAHWYTPNGKNIDKQGITPDVSVKASSKAGQDPQKDKAMQILRAKL